MIRTFTALGILLLGIVADSHGILASPLEPFFERHCYDCHSGQSPEAGLDLAVLARDVSDPAVLQRFVRIHDRIATGEMPPAESDRPTQPEITAVTRFLDEQMHAADAARIARSGRARLRRLTRAEFENTLKDILALERLDIQGLLPADGQVAGYTKVAEALDLSPVHLAAYAAAVEQALDAAIATRSTPPPVFTQRIYPASLFKFRGNLISGNFVLLKDKQPDPALPIRGGFEEIKGYINKPNADADMKSRTEFFKAHEIGKSESAVGIIESQISGHEAGLSVAPVYAGLYRLRFSIWGFRWNKGTVEPGLPQALALRAHAEGHQQEGGRLLSIFTAWPLDPREHVVDAWLDAHESLVVDAVSILKSGNSIRQVGGRTAGHAGPGVALDWFEVEGPINTAWPPESHRRLFGDLPIAGFSQDGGVIPPTREVIRSTGGYRPNVYADIPAVDRKPPLETVQSSASEDDARRLLAAFMPRAFRRPVTSDEVAPYVALVAERLAARECFEDAMRRAYIAILTSPEFLFLPADTSLDLHGLASRLSYWLWNSPPDEPLLAAAADGTLGERAVLLAHVDRLLADPKSDRFIHDFANQWLELRRLDETTPDRQLYPEYSFLLHEGIAAEPPAFLRELITHNLPITALVDADFTMLTQRLAEHYAVPGVEGAHVRRVALPPGSHRGGLLAQAAIHKLSANGTTTTPVKRGVWIMDRLLDDPAPPPPPGVAGIDPDTRGATTIREQLARHRSDTACAACHAKIDPPGFALECFDPVGGYRTRYRSTGTGDRVPEDGQPVWPVRYRLGPPVDATGQFADGRSFDGIDGLKAAFAADPERLARAFTNHMIRYATGADLTYADRRAITALVASCVEERYGLRSLIHAIATSGFFPHIRLGESSRP